MTAKLVPKYYVWDRWGRAHVSLRFDSEERAWDELRKLEERKRNRPLLVRLGDFLTKGVSEQYVVLADYELESDEEAPEWD